MMLKNITSDEDFDCFSSPTEEKVLWSFAVCLLYNMESVLFPCPLIFWKTHYENMPIQI